jgi:hypothetical protein
MIDIPRMPRSSFSCRPRISRTTWASPRQTRRRGSDRQFQADVGHGRKFQRLGEPKSTSEETEGHETAEKADAAHLRRPRGGDHQAGLIQPTEYICLNPLRPSPPGWRPAKQDPIVTKFYDAATLGKCLNSLGFLAFPGPRPSYGVKNSYSRDEKWAPTIYNSLKSHDFLILAR